MELPMLVTLKAGIALVLGLCVYFFARPIFSGAPYAATKKRTVAIMVRMLGEGSGRRAADLGSGDGRIVIALALQGFESHGYELNPLLVWYSRYKIKRAGLGRRAFIHRKSYWEENFTSFDVITIFGITYIMEELEKKLRGELRPGSKIVCNRYLLRNSKPTRREDGVSLYAL